MSDKIGRVEFGPFDPQPMKLPIREFKTPPTTLASTVVPKGYVLITEQELSEREQQAARDARLRLGVERLRDREALLNPDRPTYAEMLTALLDETETP